ncbi:MAG: Fic family protein [Pseudomonadales bacterium]|nr:Fic family protein [Pseudomonadales bacterium]
MPNDNWVWKHPNWPNFVFPPDQLADAESTFIKGAGINIGIASQLNTEQQGELEVQLLSAMALETSEIEGEILNRDSVQASIRKQLGLQTEPRTSTPAESGIAEMMVSLFQRYQDPLTHETLSEWHCMVMQGPRDIGTMGAYRTHQEPMQIVSGPEYDRKIHFEAPPSSQVKDEMNKFLTWFTDTAPDGYQPMGPLTRAAIAHVWFECIHPYEDGNGRIGRAIAEKAIAQSIGCPTVSSLSNIMLERRKQYYAELAKMNRRLDIEEWLSWFADVALSAQQNTRQNVLFLIEKAKLFDRTSSHLNQRQEKVISRLFDAGPKGFIGGLSAANYRSLTGASTASTTRDLTDLVGRNILTRTGERKSTRYYLNIESDIKGL